MWRPIILVLLALSGSQAVADTTNRALQVSPVPGVFVGGVGLLCENADSSADSSQYFLLTKSRTTFGWADFSRDDDIGYTIFAVEKSPDFYRTSNSEVEIAINRKTLKARIGDADVKSEYGCEAMSITNLHNAAKLHLQTLLKGNKI